LIHYPAETGLAQVKQVKPPHGQISADRAMLNDFYNNIKQMLQEYLQLLS